MHKLRMTYAKYEDGQVITTISGAKRLKTFCIACNEPVHFVKEHTRKHPAKDEKIDVRAHFRHTNNIQVTEAFLRQHHPESIAHRAAKQALVAGNFHFSIRCCCGDILPIKLGGERREEVSYDKYRLDVAYMNGDTVVGGVEVLHSSRVSDEKFRFLEKNLPWCEVKADKVLTSTGQIFAERSHNQVCERCERIERIMIAENARKKKRLEQQEQKRLEQERLEQERLEQERLDRDALERWKQNLLEHEMRQEKKRLKQEREQKRMEARQKLKMSWDFEGLWANHQKEMERYNKLLN